MVKSLFGILVLVLGPSHLKKVFNRTIKKIFFLGNLTLKGAILPALFEALANALDTEELVAQIKRCQILSEKVEMWQKLKEMAFGKYWLNCKHTLSK